MAACKLFNYEFSFLVGFSVEPCIVFFMLKRFLTSHRNIKRLLLIIFVVGVIEAIYGLIQALIPSVGVFGVDYGYSECARGSFVCRNHFAGFLEMVWPLGLAYTMTYGNWEEMSNHDVYDHKKVLRTCLLLIELSGSFLLPF